MTISHGADTTSYSKFEYEADVRLRKIEDDLENIAETLAFIKETIVKADTAIAKVASEVMPTVNGLAESPMLKMLMGGKKK